MIWISLALVIISTEFILAFLYYLREIRKPIEINIDINAIEDRLKGLEDQVSNIRVAQGMRRRDG
jgi:uncharacterized membrane protein